MRICWRGRAVLVWHALKTSNWHMLYVSLTSTTYPQAMSRAGLTYAQQVEAERLSRQP